MGNAGLMYNFCSLNCSFFHCPPRVAVALKSYASLVIEQILTLFCTRSKGSRSLLLCAISYYCKAHAWPAAVSIETRW